MDWEGVGKRTWAVDKMVDIEIDDQAMAYNLWNYVNGERCSELGDLNVDWTLWNEWIYDLISDDMYMDALIEQ